MFGPLQHFSALGTSTQHADTSAAVPALHVVEVQSAFILLLSSILPAGHDMVEHLALFALGACPALQHAVTSPAVPLLHAATAQKLFDLVASMTLPMPQKSAGAEATVEHLACTH